MSRFDSEGDCDFNNAGDLWWANFYRALGGKRGQQDLRDLEAALLELPEKRLISNRISDGQSVCAVGALAVHRRCASGEDREKVMSELARLVTDDEDNWDSADVTAQVGKSVGMRYTLAWGLGSLNDDDFWKATPEERYKLVLAWVRRKQHPVAV